MFVGVHEQMMLESIQDSASPERWARELYAQASKEAWWQRLFRFVIGENGRLLAVHHLIAGGKIIGQHDAGLQQVPISQICGSESSGRRADFDNRFRPRNPYLMSRWLSVAEAWFMGIELPPVKLIQVGNHYFVRDGHHRISVAAAAGQDAIRAYVLVRQVRVPAERRAPEILAAQASK